MRPKRDYGAPTRRSQRLTTASEDPITQVDDRGEVIAVTIAEGTEPEEPARLTLGENREQDTPLPSIEEDTESEDYNSALEDNTKDLEEAAYYLPLKQEPNLPTCHGTEVTVLTT